MSFCSDVKYEIITQRYNKETFWNLFSGLVKAKGIFSIKQNQIGLQLNCEFVEEINLIKYFIEKEYNTFLSFNIDDEKNFDYTRYKLEFPVEICKDILLRCGIFDENSIFKSRIDDNVFQNSNTMKSFLKGVFLANATSSIVLGERMSGYHLEFVFENRTFSEDFSELLAKLNIISKRIERKNQYVVYIKSVEIICDLLALLGASKSAIKLLDENSSRQYNNMLNRQMNCSNANLSKTMEACVSQVEAIMIIDKVLGIKNLPIELAEICELRLNNKQSSLNELSLATGGRLSKSTINKRLAKILKISKELKN